MGDRTFLGFHRPNGDIGIRNHLLILNATGLTAPVARRVHGLLKGSRLFSTPYGMGLVPADLEWMRVCMLGLARNANVGAVLILSADRPMADLLLGALATCGKPVEALTLDKFGRDSLRLTEVALRHGAMMTAEISRLQRRAAPWSALCVGLECGLSDPTSGMAANPLVGQVSDRLVADGGRAVFGETLEWLGCEDQLAARAVDAPTAAAIRRAVHVREHRALDQGIDLVGKNPNQANIDSGLSTIEEKAIGSVAKSGFAAIQSLVDYGTPIRQPGLHAMDGASYSPESMTGFVSAGAQLILFTTGVGNSYVSAICPTIKLTANADTARTLAHQIDFDASGLVNGEASADAVADDLCDLLIAVASGALTMGEIVDEGDEVVSLHANL